MRFTRSLLVFLLCTAPAPIRAQIASNNPHGEIEAAISCGSCHQTEAWTPLREEPAFSHNTQTGFPLTGSHTTTDCASCHIDLRFDEPGALPEDCGTCHLDVHQGLFGQRCVDCHNTSLFQVLEGIELHAQTSFPLAGTHAQLNCISCHTDDTDGAFTPLETACISCHEEDYNEALTIDHAAADFSVECGSCHNDLQWQGAFFEHLLASSGYELIGSHAHIACASCHSPPDQTLIFTPANDQDCVACHRSDYDAAHSGTGFSTMCTECHGTDDWEAEFDHDGLYFPIYSGSHRNAWTNCQSCHIQPETFSTFSCEGSCHRHTQQRMADRHRQVNGYAFDSVLCLNCHPRGRED